MAQNKSKKDLAQAEAIRLYELMYMSRDMDRRATTYARRGMGWSFHARSNGHEGIQVALGSVFRAKKDYLFTYYRDMGSALAAGMSPYEIFLNGLSKADDTGSGGRHMSNHFAKPELGIQSVSSCTGNHALHAVGLARAVKYYKHEGIVFCSQGDSSVSEGYCYEAFNGASREKLPVIFVIQNNHYGISVPSDVQNANEKVADNFTGLGNFEIISCDGTDVLDSLDALNRAIAVVKKKNIPAMVHAECIRIGAHSNADAHELYRSKEELEAAELKDPVALFRSVLQEKIGVSERDIASLEAKLAETLDAEAQRAEKAVDPTPESVEKFCVPESYQPQTKSEKAEQGVVEKLREAINRTLKEEFEHNPNTFLWGQDVASKEKGGVFNLTKGLLQAFGPARIYNAPLCEDYIVGTANGMSRFSKDIRIVIEAAQFADYVWPAMEQIVEMGHEYWRTNGQFCPNVVMRLASGGYIQGGLYHSQNVEAIMGHLPGIRVVYPSCSDDAAGLLRTAIRSEGPTFFLEPKYLYNRKEARGPKYDDNYAIEFGKGRVLTEGSDLSIITYGNTTHMCVAAAAELEKNGHSVEVFDLRSLKPFDKEGIKKTVKKTGRALIVHEDHLFSGLGGEFSAFITEECFEYLDAPVKRVGAKDIPIGFAKSIEREILPQVDDIFSAAEKLLKY